MTEEETKSALIDVMVRTLDGWLLLHPQLTHDAVVEWLESIQIHAAKEQEIDIWDDEIDA